MFRINKPRGLKATTTKIMKFPVILRKLDFEIFFLKYSKCQSSRNGKKLEKKKIEKNQILEKYFAQTNKIE